MDSRRVLTIEIVTPEKKIFEGEADSITANTAKGEITILPGHIALFAKLSPGVVVVRNGSREEELAVSGGFAEVVGDKVSVLADYASKSSEVEMAKAEEARKRAEEAMKAKASRRDFVIAEAELRKAIAEIRTARRHRSKF